MYAKVYLVGYRDYSKHFHVISTRPSVIDYLFI